ncbi:MAG: transcription antitermination factor NusB [Chloroflexi bacterium]|nr:transcription antitermination factor NusB [Chloroflexota bacterium]
MADTRPPTTRRHSRIVALQVLYETDMAGRDMAGVLERRIEEDSLSTEVAGFARTLVNGVLENREEIDKIVARFAPSWPIHQMAVVDRNILRVAIFEIILGGETPPKVAINEAVELAKVFASDSSPKFVNGVLGSVMETVSAG